MYPNVKYVSISSQVQVSWDQHIFVFYLIFKIVQVCSNTVWLTSFMKTWGWHWKPGLTAREEDQKSSEWDTERHSQSAQSETFHRLNLLCFLCACSLLYPKVMACLTEMRTMTEEYSKQVLQIQDIEPDVISPLIMEIVSWKTVF